MICSLFLAFLVLPAAMVATPRADRQCPACGEPALDVESHRELLLNLAKRSIIPKVSCQSVGKKIQQDSMNRKS